MNSLRYFISTPSRYRRDAILVSTGLLTLALSPVFWLFGQVHPINMAAIMGGQSVKRSVSATEYPRAAMPMASTGVSPAAGPAWPARGVVTAEFGGTGHPFTGTHTGIDIAGPANQPIHAFMPGTVTAVGALSSGCGRCVFIDHGNGLTSHYSHMSNVAASPGQHVVAGTVLGYQGTSGWSTGPHVHFEVKRNGVAINPRNVVPGNPPQ